MFNILFYFSTALLFVVCALIFMFQSVRALHFRRNIADTHGFTEGIMTGVAYPIQIILLSAIFAQFLSFILYCPVSELQYCMRSGIYIFTVISFFIAKTHTPTLLAYWFGKTALWDNFGEDGKISYSDIYCASLPRKAKVEHMNTQRLCKFSFYAKNRTKHGLPIKFSCKMTSLELKALSRQVDIRPYSESRALKKEMLHKNRICSALPYIKAICIFSLVMLVFSSGIMYPRRCKTLGAYSQPVDTITQITSVKTNGNTVCVYFERVGSADFYSVNGEFLFSVLFPFVPFAEIDLRLTENEIIYRLFDKVYYYELTTGNQTAEKDYADAWEIFSYPEIRSEYSSDGISVFKKYENGDIVYLLERSDHCFCSFTLCWVIFCVSLTVIFVLNFIISDRTPPKKSIKKTTE